MVSSNKPIVTIVMPAFNAGRTITSAINSILNQNFQDWELIIIDDGSVDDTLTKVKQVVDERVKHISLNFNGGVASARNIGVNTTDSEFIAFLDADDLWEQNKLSVQIGLMSRFNWDASFHDYETFGKWNKLRCVRKNYVNFYDLLKKNHIGFSTLIIRRSIFEQFNPIRHEDYDFLLTVSDKHSVKFQNIRMRLSKYRLHDKNLTKNKFKSAMWHYQVLRKHEPRILNRVWYMFIYAIANVVRF